MAVTQENATVCQKCGKLVGDSKFCPYCGEAVTQNDLPTDSASPVSTSEITTPPPSKAVWQRLPLWAKILPFVLIVLIAFAPVIVNSISNAVKEAKQKAAEEAFMAGRQAIWAEYATRWNSYADQGETAPTKGTQYPFQPVEGYQDAVAFGSGQVSVDLDAYYYAPNVLGTVTYTSDSDYLETDVYDLCYIFAGEEHADELTQSFREYTSTHIPEAISSIQINLSNTTDGTFNPSLEFGYSYADCLRVDDSPYGVSFNTTLTQFIDRWNSYIESNDNGDFGAMSVSAMYGWNENRVVHTTMSGLDHYSLAMGMTNNCILNVFVHGDYVVETNLTVSKSTYALEPKFVANYLNNAMCATGISDMSVDELDNGLSWQQGILFYGKETSNGNGVIQGCLSITQSAYKKLSNGTLEDDFTARPSDTPNNSQPLAPDSSNSSGQTLPYVIRATEEMPIYSGPGVNYDYNGSLPPSTYTIVEESGGQGANLWGKLKSGAGWIALDHVQLRDSGADVLGATANDPGASVDTPTATPSASVNVTPIDKAPTAAEVYTAVSAAAGGTSATTNLTDSLGSFYDIQTSDLEDYALYIPAISATREEIFVAKVKPGKMDAVKSACQSRLQSLQEDAEIYPDTGAYVAEAKLVTNGNWVMFCVVPNASGAVNAFQNSTATKTIFIGLPPDVMDKSSVVVRIDVGSDTVYTQAVETVRFPISPLVYGKGTEQVSIYIDGSLVEQYTETFS